MHWEDCIHNLMCWRLMLMDTTGYNSIIKLFTPKSKLKRAYLTEFRVQNAKGFEGLSFTLRSQKTKNQKVKCKK